MIERQHGKIQIECDSCGQVFDGDTDDWDVVWTDAKDEGWRARKRDDKWTHACPECA